VELTAVREGLAGPRQVVEGFMVVHPLRVHGSLLKWWATQRLGMG
jgi:hypothetical protein